MRQSFLGRIRLHLQSSEIPAQMGRPFSRAPVAYGFFSPLGLGNSERKGEKGSLLGCSVWAAATELPAWVVTVFLFYGEGKCSFQWCGQAKGERRVHPATPLLPSPVPAPLAPRTPRVTSSLDPNFTFGTVKSDLVRSTPRNCSRSLKGPCWESLRPGATFLRDASPFTRHPHRHSLKSPLCLALGISWGLRTPSPSAGCPGDWLPALTARWGSRPAPLPGVSELARRSPAPLRRVL